jgi:cytochrome b involved in lipid metabolism
MFAGGSGIAPFRGFWQARINSGVIGRNLLFLGVQSRKKFLYKHELRQYVQSGKLELHVAFSRDSAGLVYDSASRDLIEKTMEPRYIDATIMDQGPTVCDLIISTKLGGLGGHIYICGSVSLYETVMRGFRNALYQYRAVTQEGADELLAQAFAERRCMLDVFMTPRVMSEKEPFIPMSELSRHTGHREGSKMWIGVHGSVYDVTDFLPIHPGGTLIVAGSAGIDASVTFDEVAHTTNPEVMSLLSKYFIGYLTPKPNFHTPELNELYDNWVEYMRTTVESLTTLSFEVDTLKKDSKLWFSDGLLSTHAIRKLYQLQSR